MILDLLPFAAVLAYAVAGAFRDPRRPSRLYDFLTTYLRLFQVSHATLEAYELH